MQTDKLDRINDHTGPRNFPAARVWAALLLAALPIARVAAQETNAAPSQPPVEAKTEKGPPLPLHQIEGNGGIFSTLSAYIVNPPRNGEPIGRPSVGFAFVDLGNGRNLEAFTLTESPWKPLELGYAYDRLDLGDLPQAIEHATTVRIRDREVALHNFNARLQFLKEGEFDRKWIPALTAGAHYKYNDGTQRIDHDLGGALNAAGITGHDAADFTLYASKLFTQLPRPVLLEAGGRATKGVWNGLGGFTDDYSLLFEGNVVVFVTPKLALAAEYRQQPNDYKPIIVGGSPWWAGRATGGPSTPHISSTTT